MPWLRTTTHLRKTRPLYWVTTKAVIDSDFSTFSNRHSNKRNEITAMPQIDLIKVYLTNGTLSDGVFDVIHLTGNKS